ncbi:MAG: deoxyribose-phosphate aldolase [Acidobacteriaceae bacterium]|nr:deoxyribose-phosphate aldolase [Acidobacteriaceae bacterium]
MLAAHKVARAPLISPPEPSKAVNLEENLANAAAVAALIDHTLLKPEASRADIARVCEEARRFHFASVCINPYWVQLAAEALHGSPLRVCTVIGFPLGASQSRIKMAEAELALSQGATELDMVQNVGALRSGDKTAVREEIAELTALAHSRGAILKVILETCLLTDKEKVTACELAAEAKADFVKTSTGFAAGGATVADVALMRRTVGDSMGVKASGGVRTLIAVREMVHAGATRIGTSSGANIIGELESGYTAESPKPLSSGRVPGGEPDTY